MLLARDHPLQETSAGIVPLLVSVRSSGSTGVAYAPKPLNFQYLEHLIATALEPPKGRRGA